jgi:hypothetical protein
VSVYQIQLQKKQLVAQRLYQFGTCNGANSAHQSPELEPTEAHYILGGLGEAGGVALVFTACATGFCRRSNASPPKRDPNSEMKAHRRTRGDAGGHTPCAKGLGTAGVPENKRREMPFRGAIKDRPLPGRCRPLASSDCGH